MDAWPTTAARVPAGLTPLRGWRWCVLRTLRDGRLAQRRGCPLSRSSLERLFCRRWARITAHGHPRMKDRGVMAKRTAGRKWIRQAYADVWM